MGNKTVILGFLCLHFNPQCRLTKMKFALYLYFRDDAQKFLGTYMEKGVLLAGEYSVGYHMLSFRVTKRSLRPKTRPVRHH